MGDNTRNGGANGQQQADARALVAVIEAYEGAARALRSGWDPDAYAQGGQLFEQLRELALRLHPVHAEWVAVLISRFEFTDALWQQRGQAASGARLHEVHEVHAAALRKLRLACAQAYRLPPG